jgi:dTDP-4-dehydrorhamnose 3,5-epimerase
MCVETMSDANEKQLGVPTKLFGINGPIIFKPNTFHDARGFFCEFWNDNRYNNLPVNNWKQINHSFTLTGGIRGLHYRNHEVKFISVVTGLIWDVVVDIRPDSDTLGKWLVFN